MRKSISEKEHTSVYHTEGSNCLHYERILHLDKPQRQLDVFGNYWSFFSAKTQPKQCRLKRFGEYLEFCGSYGVIIPPFSLIDWHLGAGVLEFSGFSFRTQSIDITTARAVAFRYENETLPKPQDLAALLQKNRRTMVAIDKAETHNEIAFRAKKLIESTYFDEVSISDLAKRLEVPRESVARAFKKCFDLSPIEYRNKLRVTDSFRMLLTEKIKICDAGLKVGFNDLSRYNKQFRRHLLTTPKKYKTL